jgi:hypothetical protein
MLIAASSAATEDYGAAKARLQKLIDSEEFQAALSLGKTLNRQMPDDLDVYECLVIAHLALDQIKDAETAAQWMLDLRTEDPRSFYAAARVRESLSEMEGARQFYLEAYRRTSRFDGARRAMILSRIEKLKREAN